MALAGAAGASFTSPSFQFHGLERVLLLRKSSIIEFRFRVKRRPIRPKAFDFPGVFMVWYRFTIPNWQILPTPSNILRTCQIKKDKTNTNCRRKWRKERIPTYLSSPIPIPNLQVDFILVEMPGHQSRKSRIILNATTRLAACVPGWINVKKFEAQHGIIDEPEQTAFPADEFNTPKAQAEFSGISVRNWTDRKRGKPRFTGITHLRPAYQNR